MTQRSITDAAAAVPRNSRRLMVFATLIVGAVVLYSWILYDRF